MKPKRILIAVPTYRGEIKSQCADSLIALQSSFTSRGIEFDYQNVDATDISMARNLFGSRVVNDKSIDALLFVDSDMTFKPSIVDRLIDADKNLIGCAYPYRQIDMMAFHEASKIMGFEAAMAKASRFAVRISEKRKRLNFINGICAVDGLGMGLCYIRRGVFDKLAGHPDLARWDKHHFAKSLPTTLYGFFNHAYDPNQPWLEDMAFCDRWITKCGGEVWMLPNAEIGHVGEFIFRANYLEFLKLLPKISPP